MLNPRADIYTQIDSTSEYTLDMVGTDKIEIAIDDYLHLTLTRDGLLQLTRMTDDAITRLDQAISRGEEAPAEQEAADTRIRALTPNPTPTN
ncbi:hypothetical protein [Actinokineospora inagensis]|uniref:hypothetical protein n=1 Tax=Actinokineospora inagensis TaxID=103730 RepID=UPI0004191AC7|nr:hypothetical protein [Actinokineospora inagensis]